MIENLKVISYKNNYIVNNKDMYDIITIVC